MLNTINSILELPINRLQFARWYYACPIGLRDNKNKIKISKHITWLIITAQLNWLLNTSSQYFTLNKQVPLN